MISLDLLYKIRERIPKNIRRIIPKIIRRQINKKFFKYYFLKVQLKSLPNDNYPEKGDLQYQKSLIEKFNIIKKQTSFMTCPHLMALLSMKFKPDESFNFLDFGGEKIDFYLSLKKNFKNVKYSLYNQKSINEPFHKIKNEFNFDELHVIDSFEEVLKKDYDFVNFGSCVQYLSNYEEVLEKISKNTKCIFFSGTHLFDSDNQNYHKYMIVKQVNVLPQENYLYFFNRINFFKIFTENEYQLAFENKNLTDKVNYDNFKDHLSNISYSDFLFIKR